MKLLPLFPRGIGTREVESLGSFLMRSAIAHRMPTPGLMATLFYYFSGKRDKTVTQQNNCYRLASHEASLARPAKGAIRFAEVLNRIYGTGVFSSLGLLRLYPEFRGFRGAFFTGFRWCPICWQQDLESGQDPYFRYIWSLSGYNTCDTHECRLIDRCVACGVKVTLALRRSLYHCSGCGASLMEDENVLRREPLEELYRDIVDAVEFIQLNPDWQLSPGGARALFPKFMIDAVCEDDQRWMAQRLLGNYQEKPTFVQLRRLCWFFRVDLWRVLSSRNKQLPLLKLDGECAEFPPGIEIRTKIRPPGDDKLLAQLKRLLHANTNCPKPARFYAREIGISTSGFQYRYPELYKRIVSFYEFHQRAERTKLKMQIDMVLAFMRDDGSLDRGVKKICRELMADWGFPKNVSREKIKHFRDSI